MSKEDLEKQRNIYYKDFRGASSVKCTIERRNIDTSQRTFEDTSVKPAKDKQLNDRLEQLQKSQQNK